MVQFVDHKDINKSIELSEIEVAQLVVKKLVKKGAGAYGKNFFR
jgi:hypothetical protein